MAELSDLELLAELGVDMTPEVQRALLGSPADTVPSLAIHQQGIADPRCVADVAFR